MKAWFISDLHLKDINERNSIRLLRFLRFVEQDSQATHLFLLGDIFDLWVGDSDRFVAKFRAIVEAILAIKKKGLRVVYFEGNHDLHVRRFWQDRYQIETYVDAQIFPLGKWTVRLEHGDFINPDDEAYLQYRSFIRQNSLEKLAYILPGSLIDEAGMLASKLSRQKSSKRRDNNEALFTQMIHDYARSTFMQSPFDYIITGHMHIRDQYTWSSLDRNPISINLGSWFDKPMALSLDEQGHQWLDIDSLSNCSA